MFDASPSSVQDWLRCPRFHRYSHLDRWEPLDLGKKDFAALVGEGVHAGLAHLYLHDWDRDEAAEAVNASVITRWQEWETQKRRWPASPKDLTRPLADWQAMARGTVRSYAISASYPTTVQSPLVPLGETYAVELRLGRARLDWLGKITPRYGTRQPEWAVGEFKTKLTCSDWLRSEVLDVSRSWQLYDYLSRASSHVGEFVGLAIQQTLVVDHFQNLEASLRVTEAELLAFERNRKRIWDRIKAGDDWQDWTRCKNFGFGSPCDFLNACWLYGGDPDQMILDYVHRGEPAPVEMPMPFLHYVRKPPHATH